MGWTLVTGASGGIGAELARQAAVHGEDVVLVARSKDKIEKIAEGLNSFFGVRCACYAQDLTEKDAAVKLHKWCSEQGIQVDNLINNAGFGDQTAFLDADWDRQYAMVQLNVVALMQLCYEFGRDMRERGEGHILNLSSVAAFMAGPYMSLYYATKGYVLQFSEALSYELRGTGVTVTALCPGPTSTGFERNAHMGGSLMFQAHPQSAADVAMYGYRAMLSGKPVAYHSPTTHVANVLARLLPRNVMTAVAAKVDGKPQPKSQPQPKPFAAKGTESKGGGLA
ncbi:MAG: SDR family NAD(P)-dependent oxidoreductase [Tractidigestivibacter sp.]|uniref:SDR family NAD(P)-dependent oxidoreductase n=1 Tax=Tractidigestivibacter sp. TaxID=2847320 RepID=UPI003D8A1DBB